MSTVGRVELHADSRNILTHLLRGRSSARVTTVGKDEGGKCHPKNRSLSGEYEMKLWEAAEGEYWVTV